MSPGTVPSSFAPFDGPRFKVIRAQYHIRELDHDRERMHTEPWPDPFDRNALLKQFHAPIHLSMALGDALHNLRSALDLLAMDVVLLNKGNPENVKFPFGINLTHLRQQIKDKNFNRAHPKAVDHLENVVRPYTEGGNKALRALHDLDIQDKHEMILPVIQATNVVYISKAGPDGSWPGTACCKCGASYGIDPKDGQAIVEHQVLFPPGGSPFAGDKVIPTLHGLAQTVSGVIDSFRDLLVT